MGMGRAPVAPRKDFLCVELKDDRELYVVRPEFAREIEETQLSVRTLYLAMTRQGIAFPWPIKLPNPDGRKNEWANSERLAAMQATTKWTRVWANMGLGAYEHCYAEHISDDPVWPDLSFSKILEIAFRGRDMIDSHDHSPARKWVAIKR